MIIATTLFLISAVVRAVIVTDDNQSWVLEEYPSHSHFLETRQAGDGPFISDPNRPPTLFYLCAMYPTICDGIVQRLSAEGKEVPGSNGVYTTLLNYAPQNADKRRKAACGNAGGKDSFTNKCKYFYSCDQTRPDPYQMRLTCDEFPFAAVAEGGAGAKLTCVPGFEQSYQGNLNMIVGLNAADLVNGQIIPWVDLPKADDFARPFILSIIPPAPYDSPQASTYGLLIVTGIDGVEHSIYRTATQPPLTPFLDVVSTYNHDTSTFMYNKKPVKCSCPASVTTSCQTCIPTQRPPFNGNAPDGLPIPFRKVRPTATPIPQFEKIKRTSERLASFIRAAPKQLKITNSQIETNSRFPKCSRIDRSFTSRFYCTNVD